VVRLRAVRNSAILWWCPQRHGTGAQEGRNPPNENPRLVRLQALEESAILW